jgi:hypothetical protein
LPGKEAAAVTGAVARSGQAGSNADGSAPRLECSDFSFTIPQFQGVNGDQLLYARLSRCVVVASDFHTADEISVSVNHVSPIIMFHWRGRCRGCENVCLAKIRKGSNAGLARLGEGDFSGREAS